MDHVGSYPFSDDQIDREIAIAIEEWEALPELAGEWDTWDDDSWFSFFLDWPVVEERTARLLAVATHLPPHDARVARLRLLREIVDRNRPILQELRARAEAGSPGTPATSR